MASAKVLKRRPRLRTDGRRFRPLGKYTGSKSLGRIISPAIISAETAEIECEAVAAQSARVKDAAKHVQLTIKGGRQLSAADLEYVVHAIADGLGMSEHQYWGDPHDDAAELHIHWVGNRVHPTTFKVTQTPYDYAALDRVCRRLETHFGLEITPSIGEHRSFHRGDYVSTIEPSQIKSKVRSLLYRTGKPSFQEWLGLTVGAELYEFLGRPGVTFEDVHRYLGEHFGLQLRRAPTGRGAIVADPQDPRYFAKAGHLGRFATLPKLEARLGKKFAQLDVPLRTERSYHQTIALAPAPVEATDLYRAFKDAQAADKERKRQLRRDAWREQWRSETQRRKAIHSEAMRLRAAARKKKKWRATREVAYAKIAADALTKKLQMAEQIVRERHELRERLAVEARVMTWRQYLLIETRNGNLAAQQVLAEERARQRRMRNIFAEPTELRTYLRAVGAPEHRIRTAGRSRVVPSHRIDPRLWDGRIEPVAADTLSLVGIRDRSVLEPLAPAFVCRDDDGSFAIVLKGPDVRDRGDAIVDTLRRNGAGLVKRGALPYPGTREVVGASGSRVIALGGALSLIAARREFGPRARLIQPDEQLVGRALPPTREGWQPVQARDGTVVLAPGDPRLTGHVVTYHSATERLVLCPPTQRLSNDL